ncbi:F0F1 ATP synthase subunit B family protein [Helicobacter zhangjianzhongii]|uniref:F0F1 ATP synthase subunit B n=1 Tax=Helicobacter zhangjianzhongii TaxID=2974574 RepID=A0ACC6FSQ0_9HELI|nr:MULTISPECIES: F0F1 ATP synthase subunit B' [unclassified Helicobacter]MDL0079745.1 F0F1 ATP synthase subunit B' [Helicobacter sp. CPD2-1]MDL0082160.1 F0F1 ATP synthase subunit B' [Helicobacter sp. XJK30-2]
MSITIPDPWLMLLVFVVFIITMLLLNSWLFKPLIGFMDERENSLRKDMESAMSDDNEVQEIQEKIRAIFADAKAQASSIIESATIEAKAEYDEKMEKQANEVQGRIDSFRADLENQKNQAKQELLADLGVFETALKSKVQQI